MAEAWLNGKLDGFSQLMMPTAHALVQAINELQNFTDLTEAELLTKPNDASSIAFHLRHLTGSCDRLLTYAKGETLSEKQFEFLQKETAETTELNSGQFVEQAISSIENVLEFCRNLSPQTLFEPRFVGRQKLETNVFGLLFHIAEHTARHVGQIITTAKIVRQ
jgi:hypothetical protein